MALRRISQEIESLEVDDQVRRRFRQLFKDACLAHGVTGVDRDDRVFYARKLIDARISRATARERLMARFEISRRQSYRILNEALKLCQKSQVNGTSEADNSHNPISFRGEHVRTN